jgi:hypothetical protein
MIIMKKSGFTFFLIWCLSSLLFGQTNDDERRTANTDRERKAYNEMISRVENQRPPLGKIQRFYGKLTKEQKKRITPSEADYSKYAQFLKSPGTGIVKILPNPKCNLQVVKSDDLKCAQALPIVGMGSSYSFSKESHSTPFRYDISFTDNNLLVGFRNTLSGLIIDLGNADINSINLNTEEIQFLTSFLPEKSYPQISEQRERFAKGFESKGRLYTTKSIAKIDTTYALRSVNYYKARYSRNVRLVDFYDDITVVFRIVNVDSEGAITLIWKELKRESDVWL